MSGAEPYETFFKQNFHNDFWTSDSLIQLDKAPFDTRFVATKCLVTTEPLHDFYYYTEEDIDVEIVVRFMIHRLRNQATKFVDDVQKTLGKPVFCDVAEIETGRTWRSQDAYSESDRICVTFSAVLIIHERIDDPENNS